MAKLIFGDKDFNEPKHHKLNLHYITFFNYFKDHDGDKKTIANYKIMSG